MTFAMNTFARAHHRHRLSPLLTALNLSLGLSLGLALAPTQAEACGGTFCDAGPQVMPVDQSGETILFWIDQNGGEPFSEAHIQIQYEGDPERFAWVVPVMAVPEVLVGSQALFDNLLAATVPTLTINTRFEGDCGSDSVVGCGFAMDDAAFSGADGGSNTGGEDGFGDDTPEILDRGFAGAFEYVVLTGNTVTQIVDWLDAAGYAQDDDAPPILDEYLQEGFVFVAFKLRGGTGVNEIHPIAIRYPGTEPCIPIRLTRIAATEDMPIRALFLGQQRVVPQNWPHVQLNWAKFDWVFPSLDGYRSLVADAIDEAGGRAFVTEYAGTDSVVSTVGIDDPRWDSGMFEDIEAVAVGEALSAQGLLGCEEVGSTSACEFLHPQVRPLLERYLPAPDGVDPEQFWACLDCYAEQIDPIAWQTQPGFAAEFEERIAGPATHATAMLVDADYLTRLYTLISPHEMLEDPLFHETSSLGDVDTAITATRVNTCDDSPNYMETPDGRTVALEDFGTYPSFDAMPCAERIERVPMMGPAQVETDNAAAIDEIIDAHNQGRVTGPSPFGCSLARLRPEALLTMLALFGLAWTQRSPRQARRRRRRDQG
jgi:hypothetical protein